MTQNILTALAQLDSSNDEHWTTSGLPAMAIMQALAGAEVTRAQVNAVAPNYTRSHRFAGADEVAHLESSLVEMPPATSEEPAVVAPARERLKAMRAERSGLSSEIGRAQERLARLDEEIDRLATEVAKATPEMTPAERYRQVAQRSTEERRKRVEEARAIAGFSPRSRLDQVLGARRSFGGHRPQYPQLGGAGK